MIPPSCKVIYRTNVCLWTLVLAIWIWVLSGINAQSMIGSQTKPEFDHFRGEVFRIPLLSRKVGEYTQVFSPEKYGKWVEDATKLGEISLKEINIPETDVEVGFFPQVELKTKFCMILHSKMKVLSSGCYEFTLHSDDGSILWIEGEEYLNNDGLHGMTMMKDTSFFRPGIYEIKLWYYQGQPQKFGFVFDARLLEDQLSCRGGVVDQKIQIQNKLLFESGQFNLSLAAQAELQSILNSIDLTGIKFIEVIGHTDERGTDSFNLELSEKRATAIQSFLESIIYNSDIKISASGRGESEPISSNETEEGREKNRRVEIIFRS